MDNKKLATTLETDLNNAVFALGRLTGATIEAISRLKVASGTDETVEKESERTLQKAIAIDFDGCLCANAYPRHWRSELGDYRRSGGRADHWRGTHSLDVPRGRAA